MMGGDDDDEDTIVETQEISSENLFHIYTTLGLIFVPNGAPTSLLATTLPLLMAYPPHREVVASDKKLSN